MTKKEWVFTHNMNTDGIKDKFGDNVTVEISFDAQDTTPEPIVKQFRMFLLACGYAESTVEHYLGEN